MKVQLRIVSGSLRGRKLYCHVNPNLRPTPQMVREALFSILGNAVPGRTFIDIFSGTGIHGLEALSRGAEAALFIERDYKLANEIDQHLHQFKLAEKSQVIRSDAYRWAAYWRPPKQPVNVFLSPPFADLQHRLEDFVHLVGELLRKIPDHSVLAIQSERARLIDQLPDQVSWDERHYGRNTLLICVKEEKTAEEITAAAN